MDKGDAVVKCLPLLPGCAWNRPQASSQAETKAAMRCFMKSSDVSCHDVSGDFLASNKIRLSVSSFADLRRSRTGPKADQPQMVAENVSVIRIWGALHMSRFLQRQQHLDEKNVAARGLGALMPCLLLALGPSSSSS